MDDRRLTPRKRQILLAIVEAHISTGEPVGSKYLASDLSISCSPATVRNEMAELEEMGYLVQPHTSSGRIPSERGYRFYAETLVGQYTSTRREIEEINEQLKYKLTEMDGILAEASRLAASFTDYTGIAFKPGSAVVRVSRFNSVLLGPRDFLLVMSFDGDTVKSKTIHLSFSINAQVLERLTDALNLYLVNLSGNEISMPLIVRIEALMGPYGPIVHPTVKVIYEAMSEMDSADIRLDGITKLLQYPEYSDVSKLRSLLGVLEEKDKLMDVFESRSPEGDGIHVYIGDEGGEGMSNTALIFRNVTVGGSRFAIGVIGPMRMNYTKVIDMINLLAAGFDRLLGEEGVGGLPPATHDEE